MGGGVGGLAAPDHAMPAINGDVRLVAKDRDRDVDLRLAVGAGASLAELHRPTRVGVLLARLGRLVRPDLRGLLARLDPRLLLPSVAPAGCCHERRVHDLAGHRQVARAGEASRRGLRRVRSQQNSTSGHHPPANPGRFTRQQSPYYREPPPAGSTKFDYSSTSPSSVALISSAVYREKLRHIVRVPPMT
jgi:hypothetical protein